MPSDWTTVHSGVPSKLSFGPLLFVIYFNDLDFGLSSKVSKFADNTKLGIDAADPDSENTLWRDMQSLENGPRSGQIPST